MKRYRIYDHRWYVDWGDWRIGYVCMYYDGYNNAIWIGPFSFGWLSNIGCEVDWVFPKL